MARFALLYITQNLKVLGKNLDLLVAASKAESTEELITFTERSLDEQ